MWAAVAAVGAYLRFQASGGDIKDLTDMEKLKSRFAKSDDSSGSASGDDMPPPPPPAPPAPPQN